MPMQETLDPMSILTPSESLAFQSFLSSIDFSDSLLAAPPEWAFYSSTSNMQIKEAGQIPMVEGKEALMKATKDLMSLDVHTTNGWADHQEVESPGDMAMSLHQISPPLSSYSSLTAPYQRTSAERPSDSPQVSQRDYLSLVHAHSYSRTHRSQQSFSTGISPSYSVPQGLANSYSSPSETSSPSISTPSSFPSPPPSSSIALKRSSVADSQNGVSRKRSKSVYESDAPSSSQLSAASAVRLKPQLGPKPTLLSPSQKKANHIQSEQKRRANIRRGYEALCESIPALREAIQKEEAEQAERYRNEAGEGDKHKSGKRRRSRKATTDEGEKVDGRAGPKSENIVLQKTIDYILELKAERSTLLSRLERAKVAFPVDHLAPSEPLWEREWNGGTGAGCGEEDEEGEEGED